MSIGWVIFWKCVVVGVWAGVVARWEAFKRHRIAEGVPLRYDRQTGRHIPDNWPERVDRGFRLARDTIYLATLALIAVLLFVLYSR